MRRQYYRSNFSTKEAKIQSDEFRKISVVEKINQHVYAISSLKDGIKQDLSKKKISKISTNSKIIISDVNFTLW